MEGLSEIMKLESAITENATVGKNQSIKEYTNTLIHQYTDEYF